MAGFTEHWLAARWFRVGGNLPPRRVVIHTAEVAPGKDRAAMVANYFHTTNKKVSAHGTIDNHQLWRSVADKDVAFHAPPNAKSLGLELIGQAAMTPAQWASPYMTEVVANAAVVTRNWCRLYGIPTRWIGATELRAGLGGVCGHVAVAQAFGQSDHTDPNPNFPVASFMAQVAGDVPPTPVPVPTPTLEDDMPRLVHFENADYVTGYDKDIGPWRRTLPNPSREAQLVGGGGLITNNGAPFQVTNNQFLLVYADLGEA